MELKDFTEEEKMILKTLAVEGSHFTLAIILRNIKLQKKEANKALNSLLSKGIVSVVEKKTLFDKAVYKFNYGLCDGNLVKEKDKEKEYREKTDEDYEYEAMVLRSRVCP